MSREFKRNLRTVDTISEFYNVSMYIVLENENDIYFWRKIINDILKIENVEFGSIATCPYIDKVERGKPALKKLLRELSDYENEKIKFLIAWDSDYDILEKPRIRNVRVIDTYGYTLENSLFCPYKLARIICNDVPLNNKDYSRILSEIEAWYIEIEEKLKEMLTYDIAVSFQKAEKKGIEVMGRSSEDYSENNGALKEQEIKKKIESIKDLIKNEYISAAEKILNNLGINKRYAISGHFWESLVIKKVKSIVKSEKESLKKQCKDQKMNVKYNLRMDELKKRCANKCSEKCSNRNSCEEIKYMKEYNLKKLKEG